MNRTIALQLFFTFFCLIVGAQNYSSIEAIENKMKLSQSDTQKVQLLYDLANQYRNIDGEKTFEIGKKIISISDSIGFKRGKIMGKITLGMGYYFFMGMYEKSLKLFQEAYTESTKLDDYELINESLRGIFFVYFQEDDLEKADYYVEKKLFYNQQKNDQKEIAVYYNNKGIINFYKGNGDLALDFYLKAIKISNSEKDTLRLPTMFNNVSNVYKQKKQYNTALQYLNKSLDLNEKINDQYNIAISHIDLGEIYIENKAFDLAAYHLHLGREIAKKGKYLEALLLANKSLLNLYQLTNETGKALEVSNAIIAYEDSNYTKQKAQSLSLFDAEFSSKQKENELFIQKNEIKTKNYIIGILIFFSALFVILILALIKSNQEKKNAFRILENQKHEIKAQNDEISKMNVYLEHTIAERTEEIKAQSEELILVNQKTAEFKLMSLRSVMNSHFLFNCLNSIQFFIAKNKKEEAINYLSQFSKLIRLVLNASTNNYNSLSEEIKMLELYVNLEQLRFDKFKVKFDIYSDVDLDKIKVPSLFLQPYVENAIVHGISNNSEAPGYLEISINVDKDKVSCQIDDNGIGRKLAQEVKLNNNLHKSAGMSVTKERLDLLNNKDIKVHITDKYDDDGKPLGTKVDIEIGIA